MRKKDPEKFLRLWEKERKGGKEKYVAYRTVMMGLAIVAGSMVERALSGDPFSGYLHVLRRGCGWSHRKLDRMEA